MANKVIATRDGGVSVPTTAADDAAKAAYELEWTNEADDRRKKGIDDQLRQLDANMPRASEDTITALVDKGLITTNDLPVSTRNNLSLKASLRGSR